MNGITPKLIKCDLVSYDAQFKASMTTLNNETSQLIYTALSGEGGCTHLPPPKNVY